MLANWLGVTEIMVLLNQAVKKIFMLCFSDQLEFNGLEFFNSGYNRRLVDVELLGFFSFSLPTAGERSLSGGKCNVPLPVKFQHKAPADPILENTVGLSPVPFPADSQGQGSPALIGVVGYNLPEEVDVVGAYGTFTVSEYLGHVGNIADSV